MLDTSRGDELLAGRLARGLIDTCINAVQLGGEGTVVVVVLRGVSAGSTAEGMQLGRTRVCFHLCAKEIMQLCMHHLHPRSVYLPQILKLAL